MGGAVDADDVAGLIGQGIGELSGGSGRAADELAGGGIEGDVVARDEAADIERAVVLIDDVLAVALLVGKRIAADADRKAREVLAGLERDGVILLQEVGIAIAVVVDEPDVAIGGIGFPFR